MEKTLRLLKLLSGRRFYTLKEIEDRLDVSERTVYRYLAQIENSGYILEKDSGQYRLLRDYKETKNLQRLFHFTEEEAYILYASLTALEIPNTAVKNLIKKFHALYDFTALSRLKLDGNIENIRKLAQAAQDKKRVRLGEYRSSHSNTETDRKVEAHSFMPDYTAIWCYDLTDHKNKQFKISRMQNVHVLDEDWFYERNHQLPFTDAFRMSAGKPIASVTARLSLKAYNLIREEHPVAEQYITKEKGYYLLKNIPIANYRGIGRFFLGLPGDIEPQSPDDFVQFLNKMKNKKTTDRI